MAEAEVSDAGVAGARGAGAGGTNSPVFIATRKKYNIKIPDIQSGGEVCFPSRYLTHFHLLFYPYILPRQGEIAAVPASLDGIYIIPGQSFFNIFT